MSVTARGTFDVHLAPGPAELDGTVNRFDFTKTFKGDLEGTGAGVMLSVGDPQRGSAGYVAVEVVRGGLGDPGAPSRSSSSARCSTGPRRFTMKSFPDRASVA